jgi:hypothetical protein
MNLPETETLLSLIGSSGIGTLLGAGIVYFFIKSFIPSYFSEKGKNLATKEDIETITNKVESIKTDYARILEEVRSNNQIKLAAIEREKNTKKEVYLQAAEAITRSQNIVPSFSNLNINEETITSGITNDAGIIAKIQIVGSEITVKAVTNFMAAISSTSLELMLERMPLIQRKKSIETLESLRGKSAQEIEKFISLMKNLNLQGNYDQRIWELINKNIDFEQQQSQKFQQEIEDLWRIQNKEHLEFVNKCMQRHFEISELLPETILSVREELDMTISSEAYLDIYKGNIEKMKLVFKMFLDNIPKTIESNKAN